MKPTNQLKITKYHPDGHCMYAWEGEVLRNTPNVRQIKAFFGLPTHQVDKIAFEKGDMFIETYFTNQWFNVFEVHEQSREEIKAWYCNLSLPACFTDDEIAWTDLALDLILYPDGTYALLDLDEFSALDLDLEKQRQCWKTIEQLLAWQKKQPAMGGLLSMIS